MKTRFMRCRQKSNGMTASSHNEGNIRFATLRKTEMCRVGAVLATGRSASSLATSDRSVLHQVEIISGLLPLSLTTNVG